MMTAVGGNFDYFVHESSGVISACPLGRPSSGRIKDNAYHPRIDPKARSERSLGSRVLRWVSRLHPTNGLFLSKLSCIKPGRGVNQEEKLFTRDDGRGDELRREPA
jgi:hypothetical protein